MFFSIRILIWPLDPLNKGKIDYLLHICAPLSFYYKNTKKNLQNPSKKAKNTAAGSNILPQKANITFLRILLQLRKGRAEIAT